MTDDRELRSWASKRELATHQVASAAAIAAELRNRLAEPDCSTKQPILRLVVDKVVVQEHRLEVHLALPVSGVSNMSWVWGAKPAIF